MREIIEYLREAAKELGESPQISSSVGIVTVKVWRRNIPALAEYLDGAKGTPELKMGFLDGVRVVIRPI